MEKLRILVVDDEASIRDAISQILTMEGHVVDTASNGKDALDFFYRDYNAAFIDYKLPDVDGLALLASLREKAPLTSACMITAFANFETAVAATRQGTDVFLPKPFSSEELMATLETLANSNRLRREADRLRQENENNLKVLARERSKTRTIIECLRDGVLVVNREGLVVYTNSQTLQLLKLTEEMVMDRPLENVLAGEEFNEIKKALQNGPPEVRRVLEVDCAEKTLLVEVSSYLDEKEEPSGTIIVLRDITQEKQNREVKASFMRMMVHELRSPVSTLMSFLAVLKDKLLGESIEAYQDPISRMTNRVNTLAQLINDLLDVMRIDAAAPKSLSTEIIDLEHVILEQLKNFMPLIEEKHLILEKNIPSGLSAAADPDDVQRILANLLSNAIKYNKDGGRLGIKVKAAGDMIEIDISDTGYGIRKENQDKIFTEFFREKRAETGRVVGSGLGLSIVQKLCRRNAGRVRFVSEPMAGTTFTVSLPAAGK